MSRPDPRQLIELALGLVNTIGVENASISLAAAPSGALGVRLEFRDVSLRSGRFDGVDLDEGLIRLEGIDPTLKDPKALMQSVTVHVDRLLLRVSASLVNRVFESEFFQAELRRNAPVEVQDLLLTFTMDKMSLFGKVKKGLTFPFAVDLYLEAVNNRLRIVFDNFWAANAVPLPHFVRKMVMSVARSKIEGRRELRDLVTIDDDYALINPWPKVPVKVEGEFTRFGVEGSYLVIEMGPPVAARRTVQVLPPPPRAARPSPSTDGAVPAVAPVPSPAPRPTPGATAPPEAAPGPVS